MAKCWPLEMPTAQKFVLISLADQANDEGVCWPSVGSVIKRTGLSEASVRRAIKSLEKAELIRAEREPGKATTYTITPVTVIPLSEGYPCHSDRTPLSHRQDTPVTVIPPYTLNRQGTVKEPSTRTRGARSLPGASFDRFWSAYPKRRSKGAAEKAWQKLAPDEQLEDTILRALERAKTSVDWLKEGGKYVPYPATWLNAKGWEDDLGGDDAPDWRGNL